MKYTLRAVAALMGIAWPCLAAQAEQTLWIAAAAAEKLSPLMVKGSDVNLVEEGALGDFLVPTVTANADQPGGASFAEFRVEIPRAGTYYLWARLRYPSGLPESFAVTVSAGASAAGPPLILGGSGVGVRQWHWDSQGQGAESKPGKRQLRLELPVGSCTLHIHAHEAHATTFYPLRWRQAEPAFQPRLNVLCLTDDPHHVPNDKAACRALKLTPGSPTSPQVQPVSLPPISDSQWQASGKNRLPDWMRCPRWYTKDSWREELQSRHPGDIAFLVRQVAANRGAVLRLSVFWGGETYYQSRVAPHVPGLGTVDYLREAVDEGGRTGVKIIAYMNPNCLREDHSLFGECCLSDADGRASSQSVSAYGSSGKNACYACINHPRYRQFLRDVLEEIFTEYQPAGLYVDGLTPHVCFCEHCRAKYRTMFGVEMPAAKLAQLPSRWAVWGEYGGDPQPVGDVENDPDARRLTELLYQSLVEVTHEFTQTVKRCKPDAVTAYHSHPKPGCAADYDATLTEVYSPRPWVHTAWRCGELAGFSNVFHVPVLFNVYPHEHFTASEARYKAFQGLAAGAYPNFWSTPGMKPVFDFVQKHAEYLDFAITAPVKFLALPRDVRLDPTQAATPRAEGVRYKHDRFLAPYVGAYSALMRCGLPVVTLHRPHFHEQLLGFQVLCLANMSNMSDAQVEAVRQFVRSGGGLIATHETSLYDEKGRRRSDFALADVFGARYRRTLPAAPRRLQFVAGQALGSGLSALPPLEHEEPHIVVQLTTGQAAGRLIGPDVGSADIPAVVVHEFGPGRVVYLPGRLDALQCYELTPAVERLFGDAVRWIMRDRLPIEVSSPGTVGVSYFQQSQRLIVHLLNHDRDSRFRDDSYKPLARVVISLRLPPGCDAARVHRLWTPADLPFQRDGDCLTTELDKIDEYEVVAVELRSAAAK